MWLCVSFVGLPWVLLWGTLRGSTASPGDTLSSSLNIPCWDVNAVVPAKGSLLFLCGSVLLHLVAAITSLCHVFFKMTSCNLSSSPAVSLATDRLQLSDVSSAGVCSLRWAVPQPLCLQGVTLPAKTIPLIAFQSCSLLSKQLLRVILDSHFHPPACLELLPS